MNLMFLTATVSQIISTYSNAVDIGKRAVPYDVAFPHLNIFITGLRNNFQMFGYTIAYYGVIVALAMLIGFFVASFLVKKTYQNIDDYYDLFILVIIVAIIGARTYYVAFNWDYYQIRPSQILNIRAGGLAVYGGIIASFIAISVFCLIRRLKFFQVVDTACCGLVIGQAIGRFGNFFNMEAFGTYTNNLFAMRMKYDLVDKTTVDSQMLYNKITDMGAEYIQAHPTFLYESTCNILLFVLLLLIFFKWKKFNGQIFATYLIGYGIVRFFIEGLRTDSLYILNTTIRVSQVVSIVCAVVGVLIYVYNTTFLKQKFPIPVFTLPEKKCKEYNIRKLENIYKKISKEIEQ